MFIKDTRTTDFMFMLVNVAKTLPLTAGARIAAAVIHRGKVVGMGINSYKTHPMQKRFSNNEYKIHLHAETAAITDAMRRLGKNYADVLPYCELLIARVKSDIHRRLWTTGLAKPCEGCQLLVAFTHIKNVWWTEDGFEV